jgi:hypothetical protein
MPCSLRQVAHALAAVEGVHLEGGGVDQQPRPDEALVEVVLAQDVADVLAEEALDALAELLHAVDVACAMRQVPSGRRARAA